MTPAATLKIGEVPVAEPEPASLEHESAQAVRQEADRLEMELDLYEATANRVSGARGALFGILLGTGLWAALIVFAVMRFTK